MANIDLSKYGITGVTEIVHNLRGKEMVLLDGVNGFAEIYYMPVYPRYRCLSEERTKEWEK